MSRRALVAVVALVVLLAAAAYVVQRRDVAAGKHRTADLVFPFNTSQVEELTVKIGDRQATLVRGKGGRWEAAPGSFAEARAELAADLVGAWGRVRYVEVVEEVPEDPARYGLDEPAVRISAKLRAAAEEGRARSPQLEIGGPNPLQPSYYGRLDGFPRVVLLTAQAAEVEHVARRLLGLPVEAPPDPAERPR